jgi:F-type H+-transporting ATPase subunit b
MDLVGKVFESLEITRMTLVQIGVVVVLTYLLSALLIKPLLRVFDERENRSVKPLEESRRMLAEAETKSREYDETLRASAAEAVSRKRRAVEQAARAERRQIDAVADEAGRKTDDLKGRIAVEKEAAGAALRAEVSTLSAEIAAKVLGREIA